MEYPSRAVAFIHIWNVAEVLKVKNIDNKMGKMAFRGEMEAMEERILKKIFILHFRYIFTGYISPNLFVG